MPEFRRLTYKTPDGAWGIEGVSLLSCPARLYGAAAKLCDMESLCEDVFRAKDAELTLGAVEVVAGDAVPVVISGSRPTPAGGGVGLVVGGRVVRSVPDSGTAPEPERAESPAETPKQPNAPDKPTPILRSPPARNAAPRSHALPMSESEIVASYRQAAKPAAQITVLADLNACSKERIEEILREAGEPLPKKRGRQKQTEGTHE